MRFETQENVRLLETVARQKLERFGRRRPVTQDQIVRVVEEIVARTLQREAEGREQFSYARAVNGLLAMKHSAINAENAEEDAQYVARAMTTGTTPGSYLIPTIQADAINSQLAQLSSCRAAGARVWPMRGIQDLNVPAAVAGSPSFIWMAQNSRQTPSDPNAAQLAFDLKLSQALILLPINLFRAAVPQWDVILEDCFALGAAEAEDAAIHASSTVTNGPLALMSQSGLTTLNASNSANGGNLLYSDLLACLQKMFDLKVRPPYSWFANGRSVIRALSLYDTTSRPVWLPLAAESEGPQIGHLLGWPLYATASISTTEAVGSGSGQSHLILTNAKNCIHIADGGDVSLEASTDFALDSADITLRVGHRISTAFQPAAGICVLQGIN